MKHTKNYEDSLERKNQVKDYYIKTQGGLYHMEKMLNFAAKRQDKRRIKELIDAMIHSGEIEVLRAHH